MWRAFLLCMLPVQSLALSCTPYGIQDAYLDAAESQDTYFIVRGKLSFKEDDLPKVDWNRQDDVPPITNINAHISGVHLGRLGKRGAFSENITLGVRCFGPWCASAQNGDVVAFVRKGGNGYVLETDPCGGFLFTSPTSEQMRALQNCLDGKTCEASAFPE